MGGIKNRSFGPPRNNYCFILHRRKFFAPFPNLRGLFFFLSITTWYKITLIFPDTYLIKLFIGTYFFFPVLQKLVKWIIRPSFFERIFSNMKKISEISNFQRLSKLDLEEFSSYFTSENVRWSFANGLYYSHRVKFFEFKTWHFSLFPFSLLVERIWLGRGTIKMKNVKSGTGLHN